MLAFIFLLSASFQTLALGVPNIQMSFQPDFSGLQAFVTFDEVADALLQMDQSSGGTRTNHQTTAKEKLQNISTLNIGQNYKDVAQNLYNQVASFNATTKGANHLEIMGIIRTLSDKINELGGGGLRFTTKGGFAVSYSMLDKKISDITWPGTHNSYANDVDGERNFGSNYQNQGLSLRAQMDSGIRWLDMDIGPGDAIGAVGGNAYFVHNSGTGGRVRLDVGLNAVKDFAKANPEVVVIFDMADVSNMNKGYAYGKLREAIYSTGLNEYIYNMKDKASKQNNEYDVYTDSARINPKLKDMIAVGKNVLLVPQEQWYAKDRTYFKEIHGSGNIRQDYEATKIEERSRLTAIWNPNGLSSQSTVPERFMSLELDPDDGALAGHRFFASRNNDGRRIYQLAKWYEDRMPSNKHINYIKIDFYKDSLINGNTQTGAYNSVIHATNSLNKDRFNFAANGGELVQLFPDWRGSDLLRGDGNLTSEVSVVTNNAANHLLERSEWSQRSGLIKASGRRRHKQGSARLQWWCLPEFAMDNDFSTVWATDGRGSIEFNFRYRRDFRYVYIAWEYGMATPGFKVMGSNGGGRWDTLKTVSKVKNTNNLFQKIDLGGTKNYQYIKIETTDVDNEARTGIAEIFVYN